MKMGMILRVDEAEGLTKKVGQMETDPVKIKLKESATPYNVATARKVPFPMMDAVKCEIQHMLDNGVIHTVMEPTRWCAPMVAVKKRNGSLRICVDPKQLNKAVERENYSLPILEDIAPKLKDSTTFSKLDAASEFWQIPLEEASQLLTIFSALRQCWHTIMPIPMAWGPCFYRLMENT